jgi:hypothetical protein
MAKQAKTKAKGKRGFEQGMALRLNSATKV